MDQKFGGIIWTNHALERLKERGISQSDAWATWKNPEQSRFATNKGAWIYYRTYGDERIEVVAKKNERGEWIVLSVWSRPARLAKRVYELYKKPEPFLMFLWHKLTRK